MRKQMSHKSKIAILFAEHPHNVITDFVLIRFNEVLRDVSDLADIVVNGETLEVVTRRIAKPETNNLFLIIIIYIIIFCDSFR